MLNALSVDVEEYFQAEAFSRLVTRQRWEEYPSRVEAGTGELLELFARHGVQATFFVLGWVARRHPQLIKEICSQGHEIACHGYDHQLVYQQTPADFRSSLRKSKRILEEAIGRPVIGYRAPTFSVTKNSLWALDVLAEEGFRYDSSIFPIHHDRYGIPDAPRFPHKILPEQDFYEFPPSTHRIGRVNLPLGGGGYLRLLPYPYTHWGIKALNRHAQPALVYVHPWEIDPQQPRLGLSGLAAWRHYHNLHKTKNLLQRLLQGFEFAPIKKVLRLAE